MTKSGCTIVCDGRVSTSGNTILTEHHRKWFAIGPLAGVFAGDLGTAQRTERAWLTEEPSDAEAALACACPGEWEAIVYDRVEHSLHVLYGTGTLLNYAPTAIVGSGHDVVYGFLRGARKVTPRTLELACFAAADCDSGCNKALTRLQVPRVGKVRVSCASR
jgi:hypothetical protein